MEDQNSGEYQSSPNTVKSFDGRVWAQQFLNAVNQDPSPVIDEDFMIAWFCNAIMAGYDAGYQAAKTEGESNQPESI